MSARNNPGGIRVFRLNIIIIPVATLLAGILIFNSNRISRGYRSMREATEEYIAFQQQAADMSDASDYLTEQVRAYAATHDRVYLDGYFEETHVSHRRDKAISSLNSDMVSAEAAAFLQAALEDSEELETIEYYSMRLVADASGLEEAYREQEIKDVTLSPEDAALTPPEKYTLAQTMLYDSTYMAYKDKIHNNVSSCISAISETTGKAESDSAAHLESLLNAQTSLMFLFLIVVVILVWINILYVLRPLMDYIAHIRDQERLPVSGANEVRILARTYNEMYDENQKNNMKLSREASTDALTGLGNRRLFDQTREGCDESEVTMIIIDVDYFKNFNDTYGHDVGDQILKQVAKLLKDSFRSEDLVCRIGGDEFAVIMQHAGSVLKDLIIRKFDNVRRALREPDNGLPPVTLSIGVAFGDRRDPEGDIFKNADTALYRVKDHGRDGMDFY